MFICIVYLFNIEMTPNDLRLLNNEIDRLMELREKKFKEWRDVDKELATKLKKRDIMIKDVVKDS